ncbi:BIR-domain-containing protein [Acephala macrosclerotiorum]|nr:BIR-domain-containing protein [Acephala macrosclerotiorum]
MSVSTIADQFFTYESRLASFQVAHQLAKRRASNASTKGTKAIKWPHKFLSGEELAKAGFFYHPATNNPDNVACFLCHRNLDGWEEGDDPLAEHAKHAPNCGWATTALIERGDEELSQQYPASTTMVEARMATFSDKWPHEHKKGWKCKTKQMVDSGWKYTPTPESDDMATCVYCALALDGWEPSDKPLDEHFNRSSECAFFTLISNYKQSPAIKKTKGKGRASKTSRLSTQSQFTVASEAPSILDLPAEDEDSVLTTATNATATRGKKMAKPKKVAPAKKTRAKKSEPVEVEAAPEPEDDSYEVKIEVAPKPTRGRKRKSDETIEPAAPTEEMAPPPKRRATRTRASTAMDDSIISSAGSVKTAGRKGRASRKVSAASVAPMRAPVLDDDEIDRALEADLARSLTDNEEEMVAPEQSEKGTGHNADHAMFDPEPMQIDEAVIDAELEAMEQESKPLPKAKGAAKGKQPRKVSAKQRAAEKKAQAEAEAERLAAEEASQQIAAELEHSISMQQLSPVIAPKKHRASTRQPPRKLPGRTTRGSAMSNNDNDVVMTEDGSVLQNEDSGNETDASNSTVVRGGSTRRGSTMKKGKGVKKGPSRNIEEIVHKPQVGPGVPESPVIKEPAPSRKGKEVAMHGEEITHTEITYYAQGPALEPKPMEGDPIPEPAPEPVKAKATKPRGRPRKISAQREPLPLMLTKSVNSKPVEEPAPVEAPHSMPGAMPSSPPRSPTPPPKEATPSQSPQSSDAENHPPSSKPSAATKKTVTPHSGTRRIPLADTTPGMMSPSKRNVLAGLQSNAPWTAVDLDMVFMKTPSDENAANPFGGAIEKAKNGELTSPEKKMTVEEWIKYNAEVAEEKLKGECERMVGLFESEGMRAMQALEGVECLE